MYSKRAFVKCKTKQHKNNNNVDNKDDVGEDEEPFVFSYHQDVSKNPHIIKLKDDLTSYLKQLTDEEGAIQKYKESWKVYDTEHGLWDEKARRELDTRSRARIQTTSYRRL